MPVYNLIEYNDNYSKTSGSLWQFYHGVKENINEHNPNWSQIPDHPYRILIIGGSGSRKTNSLFNLTNQKLDIDKIYLYANDPYEVKYQFLTKIRELFIRGTKLEISLVFITQSFFAVQNVLD